MLYTTQELKLNITGRFDLYLFELNQLIPVSADYPNLRTDPD